MTLNTRIAIQADTATTIDPQEAFDLAIQALLAAGDEADKYPNVLRNEVSDGYWDDGSKELSTVIGQGLPGIIDVRFREDGPLYSEDFFEADEVDGDEVEMRFVSPAALVCVSWDTGYAYDNHGMGCSELHARGILNLYQALASRGLTLTWQNEYSGTWHKASDGFNDAFTEFLNNGDSAADWFTNIAQPAIAAHLAIEMAEGK